MNWRKLIIFFACFSLAVMLAALLLPAHEPRYRGRSLTAWLIQAEQSNNNTAEFKAATNAVLNIGTNALPYLLEWTQFPTSTLKSRIDGFLQWTRAHFFLTRASVAHDLAADRFRVAPLGFRILGPIAASAAPELSRRLRAAPDWLTATICVSALQTIGPQGIPPLCEAITNPPPKGWSVAPNAAISQTGGDMSPRVAAIRYLISLGTNAAPLAPVFVLAASDEETSVALHAILALGLTGSGQAVTVPALIKSLQDPSPLARASAADALYRLGPEAKPAVPALLSALRDADRTVRESAANTLRQIAPAALTNSPTQ